MLGVESGVSFLFAGILYVDSVVCCRQMLSIPYPSFRDFILIIVIDSNFKEDVDFFKR